MKKLATMMLALAATFTLSFAGENPVKDTYSHHYDFMHFTALEVSNAFQVDFAFADNWSVDVCIPDFIQPYLKVSCKGTKVRIGLEKLPHDIQRKLNDLKDPLKATVRMPKLLSLTLSGASRLTAEGRQTLGDETMTIDLSGASKIEALETSGNGALNMDISGASKARMKATFNQMDIDISGASKLALEGSAAKVRIDCTGASNCDYEGDVLAAIVDLSGASKMNMSGKTGNLKLDQTGATKFESTGETARADVQLSGASKCRLTVKESLQYELSGASTLRVKNLGAKVAGEQARGSKLEFER